MWLSMEELLGKRVFQRSSFSTIKLVYGMICVPPNSYVDILIPSPSECDIFRYVLWLVTQLCSTLCDPMDCSPPGSSVHGILQARILEWVAMPSSMGSSRHRDQTQVSCIPSWWIIYCLSHMAFKEAVKLQ